MAMSPKNVKITAVAVIAIVVVAAVGFILLGGLGSADDSPAVKAIKDRGVLKIGTSSGFPPFEIANGTTVEGFDIDLAQKIADKFGVELVIEDLGFEALIQSLITGKIDLILAGMTINSDRNESVLFSNPYFSEGVSQSVIIKNSTTGIDSVDDLAGKVITVNSGTTGYYWAEAALIDTGKVSRDNVIGYSTASDTIQELMRANGADAIIIDSGVAAEFVSATSGIHIAFDIPTNESYGVAVQKKHTDLADVVNEVLAEMEQNGEMDALRAKWGI